MLLKLSVASLMLAWCCPEGAAQTVAPPAVSTRQSLLSLASPLTVNWQFRSDEIISITPATDGKQVYVPTSSGGIVALNASNGKLVWRESMGGQISAEPIADEFAVFIANEVTSKDAPTPQATGAIRALSRESGVTLWMRTLPFPVQGGIATDGETVYGAASDGRVLALNKRSGQPRWIKQFPARFKSHLTLSGGRVYMGSEDGTVYALDPSGNVTWRYRTRGAVRGRPAVTEALIAIGSADGMVYVLDRETGKLRWTVRTGAAVQSVTITGGQVIAASLDNFAYCFSLAKGARIWKRLLEGRPLAQPAVQEFLILFNPISGSAAVVLDTHDGKILNNLPTGEDNNSGASPVIAGQIVMLTTRDGLLAFSHPQ
jgi:outer membrane protein assembly factor BamB